MSPFRFTSGDSPLLVSMPHVGTRVPEEIAAGMNRGALVLPDTDWHVDRLYDFLGALGASVLQADYSRYVVDLNRDPHGGVLYPGASNTELCPTSTFDEASIYRPGATPDAAEVARRRDLYWQPYHDRLREALATLRRRHGVALLWDAHSIRSHVPRFFEGRLPDLNLGSAAGTAADRGLLTTVAEVAEQQGYSLAVDGRFKGGYITRAYGRPDEGVQALQLELSQITYMDEDPPFAFREDLAARLRPLLLRMLTTALHWVEAQARAAG